MKKPRILVLTLSFGAGHLSAARSVADGLRETLAGAEVRLIDALESCSPAFRAFYVWPYWAMIRYAPFMWKRFFETRSARGAEQTAPVRAWRAGCRKVFAALARFRPDLIVAAEVGACEIAVIAKREGLTNAPIVNVITDFEAEPVWVKPEIAAYAVASPEVGRQLEGWDAPADRIVVCGIPLDDSFARRHDAAGTRRAFGLDERPAVLLMGGGMGPTRMDEIAAGLLCEGEDLQIVALPGRDHRTRARLGRLRSSETVALHVLDWTDKVAALMQTAAVLVTKPGGVTLSEAAATGLPLVLFDPIPGPEEKNAARFVEAGAAVLADRTDTAVAAVRQLLADATKRAAMSAAARRLARPAATGKIVRTIERIVAATEIGRREPFFFDRMNNYRQSHRLWPEMEKVSARLGK
ncbi:MAG: glycosyltransferase [Acidobacteria bacterium]|nr:glycosyltransferase [Acidobacteriota bacterium]